MGRIGVGMGAGKSRHFHPEPGGVMGWLGRESSHPRKGVSELTGKTNRRQKIKGLEVTGKVWTSFSKQEDGPEDLQTTDEPW